jgi:hypothetical protein
MPATLTLAHRPRLMSRRSVQRGMPDNRAACAILSKGSTSTCMELPLSNCGVCSTISEPLSIVKHRQKRCTLFQRCAGCAPIMNVCILRNLRAGGRAGGTTANQAPIFGWFRFNASNRDKLGFRSHLFDCIQALQARSSHAVCCLFLEFRAPIGRCSPHCSQ